MTFGTVTDKITSIVLRRPIGLGWAGAAFIGFVFVNVLLMAVTYLFLKGVGIWGINVPGGVGLRDHQLRVVGRYRPRRHADLRDSAAAQANLA